MTILYLVPTPLGNPDDITLRALRILREASAIAIPKYPQKVLQFLSDVQISTPTIPYEGVLDALSAGDVALVADRGTPGIGDEAHDVVRAALERGIKVEPLPGASNEISALVLSGFPTDSFVYLGMLPEDPRRYADERSTMIINAYAGSEEMAWLRDVFGGDRAVCVVAWHTAQNEILYRGDLNGGVEYFMDVLIPDGMVIVAGAPPKRVEVWDEARVRDELRARLQAGEPLKMAAKAVATAAGWDRRAVYALGVDEKRNTP